MGYRIVGIGDGPDIGVVAVEAAESVSRASAPLYTSSAARGIRDRGSPD
jgi:hypothetical protein